MSQFVNVVSESIKVVIITDTKRRAIGLLFAKITSCL